MERMNPHMEDMMYAREKSVYGGSMLYPDRSSQYARPSYPDSSSDFTMDVASSGYGDEVGYGGGYMAGGAHRGFGTTSVYGFDRGGTSPSRGHGVIPSQGRGGVVRGHGTTRGHGGEGARGRGGGRGGDQGRGHGAERGRGTDRGRGRGFGVDSGTGRGRGSSFGRGGDWGRGGDRGRGATRGQGRGFLSGVPNSWAALAASQKDENTSYRFKKQPTRGPSYTAQDALNDSQWDCQVCNLKTTGPHNLTDHLLGSKHKSAVDKILADELPGAIIPAEFLFCRLCNCSVNNHENLIIHLKGQRHTSNLHNFGKQASSGGSFQAPAVPKASKVKPSVLGVIAQVKDPLIGLEFVTEYLHIDPPQDPHYECKVCNLVLIGGNLAPHLLGQKHRLKYFENHRPDLYRQELQTLWEAMPLSSDGEQRKEDEKARSTAIQEKVRVLAKQLEEMEGRQIIKSFTLRGKNRPTQTKPGLRTLSPAAQVLATTVQGGSVNGGSIDPVLLSDDIIKREYERRFGNDLKRPLLDQFVGGPLAKRPYIPEKGKMQFLLNELGKTTISSEADASVALQVSNNLTQALLNYRLNSFPPQKGF